MALENSTSRTVFKGYGKRKDNPGMPSFYRHCAFRPRFSRYEKLWYLEVTPTYHYTINGVADDRFYEVKVKTMKRLEHNGAVLGQLMMWRHVLAPPPTTPDLFAPRPQRNAQLAFGSWRTIDVEYGVPERDWLESEEAEEVDDDTAAEFSATGEQSLDLFAEDEM